MITPEAYNESLDELVELLRKRPLTPKEIAEALGCCRPTVYHRLKSLKERGDAVYQIRSKGERPGPAPSAFGVR